MDPSAAEVDRSLERGHILALDGLRGAAILLVVVCHFVSNLHISASGWARPLIAFGHAGWTGVDLFFVLSGFLITGILIDARGSASYYKAFYARRALRIIPAYYGFLLVIFVVLPALGLGAGENYLLARQHQSWYWLYATNVMMALDYLPGFGPYPSTLFWSLAVEEQFYLFWPLIVAITPPASLKKVCLAGLVVCIVLRILGTAAGVPGLALSVLPFTRGDTLFAGGLLAVAYRAGRLDRYAKLGLAIALASLLALVVLTLGYGELDYTDSGTAMFGSIAIMALSASMLMLSISLPRSVFASSLRSRMLRFFGRYSYALYIVHTAVLAGLNHYLPFASISNTSASALVVQSAWFFAYVAASTAIAFASWHLAEKHFLRLKSHFPYSQQRQRAGKLWVTG